MTLIDLILQTSPRLHVRPIVNYILWLHPIEKFAF